LKQIPSKYNLIVILGPTASGKTRFAAELANNINSEIISADSRQIYRRMNLGTGKDYEDYLVDGVKIPVHLIDIHDPGYKYNVYEFQQDFFKVYKDLIQSGITPMLCGGTGLYIEAVTKHYKMVAVPVNISLREELDKKSLEELEIILSTYRKLHNKTDSDTKKRAIRAIEIEEYYRNHPEPYTELTILNPLYVGINIDRYQRRQKITARLNLRLNSGMIEEVESLLKEGINPEDLIYYGLEYKFITQYLIGEITYEEMFNQLNVAIHQFAKRQMTWFRKMEREGCPIHWIDSNLPMNEKLEIAMDLFYTI
jgi:tRNA dimethylallyltransferase